MVPFLKSQITIDDFVLEASFATCRCKETDEIAIGDRDSKEIEIQRRLRSKGD